MSWIVHRTQDGGAVLTCRAMTCEPEPSITIPTSDSLLLIQTAKKELMYHPGIFEIGLMFQSGIRRC